MQDLTHKGITVSMEPRWVGFSKIQIEATTMFDTKSFDFSDERLDDVDLREEIKDDDDMINLDSDPISHIELLEWIEESTVKGFYKDIVDKDYKNIKQYEITCNDVIKLYYSSKCVATGDSEIEDYIACIGR